MAKRPAQSTKIQQQIKALQMRVSFLERALKPAKKTEHNPGVLNGTRERAEEQARNKALLEYYEKKKVERYLRNPEWLATDFAYESEIAEYLKSRGLKPEPSRIPKQFHRGLKAYRPKAKSAY